MTKWFEQPTKDICKKNFIHLKVDNDLIIFYEYN